MMSFVRRARVNSMQNWDAHLYLKFADERTRPAHELLARIAVSNPRRVIDLGCGPGNSTALLRHQWPEAEVIGLDSSPDMIAAAARDYPEGQWIVADIGAWSDATPFDVIFSNAALYWVANHRALLPRLFQLVSPSGALAVQMPRHVESRVHQLILEISSRAEWRHLMGDARAAVVVHDPASYYDMLQPFAARIDVWETIYHHVMDGPEAIVEWIRGTGLRPFLHALRGESERRLFEELLLAGVKAAYPRQPDGRILFPFRRLFFLAYQADS
jgi:trans-aconitate 2-methyltransferase